MNKATPRYWGGPRAPLARAPMYILIVPLADELQLLLISALVVALVTVFNRMNQ